MKVAVEELSGLKADQVVDAQATSCPGPILGVTPLLVTYPMG